MTDTQAKLNRERREFLKQFAKASGMAIVSPIFLASCAYGPPAAAYGPPYCGICTVDLITYGVSGDAEKELINGTVVPLNAFFIIYFVHNMTPESHMGVFLMEDTLDVSATYTWVTASILKVIPETPLRADTPHTLFVSEQVVFANPSNTYTDNPSNTTEFTTQKSQGSQHDQFT